MSISCYPRWTGCWVLLNKRRVQLPLSCWLTWVMLSHHSSLKMLCYLGFLPKLGIWISKCAGYVKQTASCTVVVMCSGCCCCRCCYCCWCHCCCCLGTIVISSFDLFLLMLSSHNHHHSYILMIMMSVLTEVALGMAETCSTELLSQLYCCYQYKCGHYHVSARIVVVTMKISSTEQ